MAAPPAVLVLVVTLAGGPVDPRYQALGGPFDLRGLGGVLLAANRTALAGTVVGLVGGARALGRARGSGDGAGGRGCRGRLGTWCSALARLVDRNHGVAAADDQRCDLAL